MFQLSIGQAILFGSLIFSIYLAGVIIALFVSRRLADDLDKAASKGKK